MSEEKRSGSELGKFEWDMLQRFLDIYGNTDACYYYSLRVGGVSRISEDQPAWVRKCIIHNSRLKIDCVEIRNDGFTTIIEVKKVAQVGAIGQLLGYKYLYGNEKNKVDKVVLLCVYAPDTIIELCDHFGIELVQMNVRDLNK